MPSPLGSVVASGGNTLPDIHPPLCSRPGSTSRRRKARGRLAGGCRCALPRSLLREVTAEPTLTEDAASESVTTWRAGGCHAGKGHEGARGYGIRIATERTATSVPVSRRDASGKTRHCPRSMARSARTGQENRRKEREITQANPAGWHLPGAAMPEKLQSQSLAVLIDAAMRAR